MVPHYQISLLITVSFIAAILCKGIKSKDGVIIEGDMYVTRHIAKVMLEGNDKEVVKKDAIKADIYRWKDGVIPFIISSDVDKLVRSLITQSMNEYQKVTCIRFKEKADEDDDYVKFDASQGCFSAIGRQGGEQTISLGDGCQTFGHVLHEIMHAIGFFHEQSRFDRDLFVKILWWNIASGAFKNFATYNHGKVDTLGAPYDKHSILHYGKQAFSKNGGNTVESIANPEEQLGQEALSDIDILQINKLYSCYKDQCEDKSIICKKFIDNKYECFKNIKVTSNLCKKTCGFC